MIQLLRNSLTACIGIQNSRKKAYGDVSQDWGRGFVSRLVHLRIPLTLLLSQGRKTSPRIASKRRTFFFFSPQ